MDIKSFNKKRNILYCDPTLGIIYDTVDEGIAIANQFNCYVAFNFNDVLIMVDKYSNKDNTLEWYSAHFRCNE